MKEHHIDRLFAAKLAHHQSPPPAEAWMRIEKGFGNPDRQQAHSAWYAAAIALLATAAGLLWPFPAPRSANPEYHYADAVPLVSMPPSETRLIPYIHSQPAPPPAVVQPDRPIRTQPETAVRQELLATGVLPATSPDEEMSTPSRPARHEPQKKPAVARNLPPVTVIYKAGTPPPASENKFVKAVNYLGDMRQGKRKLPAFRQIKQKLKDKLSPPNHSR